MSDSLLQLFNGVVRISGAGILTALAVACVQVALGSKLPSRWRAMLWGLVLIRLVLPVLPESRFSALNLIGRTRSSVAVREMPPAAEVITFGLLPPSGSAAQDAPRLAASAPAKPAFSWSIIAAALWLLIVLALLMRTIIGNAFFRRRLAAIPASEDPRSLALLESCRLATGAPRVRLVETSATSSPALFGVFHPMLLIPPGFAGRVSDEELAFIFRHELIHARRRDLLIDWLVRAIVSVHWFNPIVWLAARQFRAERELACDESVVAGRPTDERMRYGQTILRLCGEFSVLRSPAIVAGLIDRPGIVSRRIHAIASPARRSIVFTAIGVISIAVIGCTTFTAAKHSRMTASTATPSKQPSNGLVTGVYDVSDLLLFVPDFSDAPSFMLTNSAAPRPDESMPTMAPEPKRQDKVNRLIREIETAVDPASWQINGPGIIRESNGQLVIEQTAANQNAIAAMLQAMHRKRSIQVTVEVRSLKLADGAFANWQKSQAGEFLRDGDFELWSKPLGRPATKALWQSVHDDRQSSEGSAPRLTLFDGQRAYALVATQQAYVSDLTMSVGAGGRAFTPTISIVQSGVIVDVQAEVSKDLKHVTLTLKPQFSDLLPFETAPWPKAPPDRSDLTIQVPHVRLFTLETTTTIPNDQAVLFRMKSHDYPGPTTRPTEERYLLVRATAFKEDESPARVSPSPTTRK
jgi:beta-lactamase regulating signal transducer with metallopeptidase domain